MQFIKEKKNSHLVPARYNPTPPSLLDQLNVMTQCWFGQHKQHSVDYINTHTQYEKEASGHLTHWERKYNSFHLHFYKLRRLSCLSHTDRTAGLRVRGASGAISLQVSPSSCFILFILATEISLFTAGLCVFPAVVPKSQSLLNPSSTLWYKFSFLKKYQ